MILCVSCRKSTVCVTWLLKLYAVPGSNIIAIPIWTTVQLLHQRTISHFIGLRVMKCHCFSGYKLSLSLPLLRHLVSNCVEKRWWGGVSLSSASSSSTSMHGRLKNSACLLILSVAKADDETTNQPTNLFTIAITLYTTLTHTQAYIVVCVMVFFIFFKNNRTEYFLLLLVSCLTKLKSEIHPLRLKGFLGVLGVSIYII